MSKLNIQAYDLYEISCKGSATGCRPGVVVLDYVQSETGGTAVLLPLLLKCVDQDVLTIGMLVTVVSTLKTFQHLLVPLRKAITHLKSETAV
jgi:hypothetical protein